MESLEALMELNQLLEVIILLVATNQDAASLAFLEEE